MLVFHFEKSFLDRYQVQRAGARIHEEYWIPADELDEFNRHIVGPIEILDCFRTEQRMLHDPTAPYRPATGTNGPIVSFRNFASVGLLAAPAG